MITGYQRQHRKTITFSPSEGADSETTDQYTSVIMHEMNTQGIHEAFSKACELATVQGMVLAQPYLDYTSSDPLQGQLKVKIWEYNSFIVDPFFRQPDMSDAQFFWCQEYITKEEAKIRFGDQATNIPSMPSEAQGFGTFYFIPENYYLGKNNFYILSYVWYKHKRKRKKLFSRSRQQIFDVIENDEQIQFLIQEIPDLEVVEVEVPTWKLAVVLNDRLMFLGDNPLKFDQCPVIPVFWNYDPQINVPDLRVRSLVRTMRDPQFLFNYKVLQNNDIAAATINAGWKRKVGAVANEDNLKKAGQGYDLLINPGYEMTDVEKIIPSAVPQSDLALADQMQALIFSTSGIDMENWAGQEDKQISTLTMMLKQAANLMIFQKYFDQWDYAYKLLGERMLEIVQNNWNSYKLSLILGQPPSSFFYSGIFARFQTQVNEGILTATQQSMEAQQKLDINQAFGREVLPPSMIIKDMNIQGKNEIMEFLHNNEMQASQMQQMQMEMSMTKEQALLQELYSKAAANIAMAKERTGRSEANIGLFQERLSEISRNHSLAIRDKMEATQKLIEMIQVYGELETKLNMDTINRNENFQDMREELEESKSKQSAASNQFINQIMAGGQQQM